MAQTVRVEDPESGGMPDPNQVPPLYPYDDKFASCIIDWWEESNALVDKIRVSPYYDGEIPDKFEQFLSTTPYSGGAEKIDQASAELDREFEREFTDTQQQIFVDIEEEFGSGPTAEEWTNAEIQELTNATDSYETVSKATKAFEDAGWAVEEESTTEGKLRRLTQSRFENPDAMTDGGGHDWNYKWEPELEKLENCDLWDAVTHNPTKFDPRDWFAHKNEGDIIDLFRDARDINEVLLEVYEKRSAYEAELEDEQEDLGIFIPGEKVETVKEIRELLVELQNSLIDFFVRLKNLSNKLFQSCVNWWSISDQAEAGKNISEEYLPTKKRNVVKKRINAKRWAFNQTHLDPLIEGNPKAQAQGTVYPQRVYELEKSVRSLVRLTWYMKEDLLEGTDTVSEGESESLNSETERPEASPSNTNPFEELDRALQAVEWTLPDPAPHSVANEMNWGEFLREYREYWGDESIPARQVVSRLEEFHEWALENDYLIAGVEVKDTADVSEEPNVVLAPISSQTDSDFFENWPHKAQWPEEFGLTDDQLIPTR